MILSIVFPLITIDYLIIIIINSLIRELISTNKLISRIASLLQCY